MRRKRLIVLNIIILVTIVTNLIIVFSNGQSMSARSHKHFADNVEIKEFHVKYSKKGVVKVTGLEMDPRNNELLINVKSVGDGETDLRIRTTIAYPNGNTVKERIKKHFETSLFGVVLDTTQMADYNNYKVTVFL